MVNVLVFIESRFPADRIKIRKFAQNYLSNKTSGKVELGINIVGSRKMKQLNQQYRQVDQPTDVLAFPLNDASVSSRKDLEVGFSPEKSAPDQVLRLGDVVICYPEAVMAAAESNKLVDEQIKELIAHGLDHLLGKHH